MYKYLIYCSISAAIILSVKYIYHHWIKQNHSMAALALDMKKLENKVSHVENELKKNKGSISGGVSIPIVFQKKDSFVQQEQHTVSLKDDLQSESTRSSRSSRSEEKPSSIQLVNQLEKPKDKSVSSSASSSSSRSSKKHKVLDLSSMELSVEKQLEKEVEKEVEKQVENKVPEVLEEETVKKVVKKKALPDAKDFNNGQKFTDDQGVEYLCIVGKRGGHSWKKITI
jgi:hypothetical protein